MDDKGNKRERGREGSHCINSGERKGKGKRGERVKRGFRVISSASKHNNLDQRSVTAITIWSNYMNTALTTG